MMKKLLLTAALLALSGTAFGESLGTPQAAKAMLEKAAAAIKADREVALAQFNKGQFNRAGIATEVDLYPFCVRLTDGKLVASPSPVATVGNDIRLAKDAAGMAFGKPLYEAMSKPEATEINYLFPKPGTTAPALPKSTIAMKVAPDLGCAVGYYKSNAASGGELGTADEAKAMLLKAATAIKADRDAALGKINKGEDGFRQGDLYPFCSRISDGTLLATPAIYTPIGADGRTLKDSTGKAYGKEMIEGASAHKDGEIFEITYRAPKPGTTTPEYPKVSFITKVGDLMCGVGHYK